MGSLKVYAAMAGFLAAAASLSPAIAADLLPPPPPPPIEPFVSDVAGGWYLRGDVGVSHYEGGKVSNPSAPAGVVFYDIDYGSGAFAGGGVGYQFNSWFRADVTAEYRFSTGFHFRDKGPVQTSTLFGGALFTSRGTSFEDTNSKYSSVLVLANGYFDLGSWYGFSPFVGAGVGWAYHMLSHGTTSTVNAFGPFVSPTGVVSPGGPPAGVSGGTIRNRDTGNLAWALHAGIGYDVTPNVKLELAYRYLNMGSIRTGVVDCYCGDTYAGFKLKELTAHDVKLGMRWAFGGPAAVYEPAPLIRKY